MSVFDNYIAGLPEDHPLRQAFERRAVLTPEQMADSRAKRDAEIREEYWRERMARLRKLCGVSQRFAAASVASYLVPPGSADARNAAEAATDDAGMWLTGAIGAGKTHLACAVVNAFVERGIPAQFMSLNGFFERLRATYDATNPETELYVQTNAAKAPVLVLDDLDKARFTDWTAERLFSLIDTRYDANLPLITTCNSDPSTLLAIWTKQGVETRSAAATIDRMREMTIRSVQVNGRSHR